MTPQESFKIGFLCACADRGLSGDAVVALVEKTASMLTGLLGAGAVAVPVAAGLGAGVLAAKATTPLEDVTDLQTRELIAELRRLARQARERQAAKTLLTT